MEEIFNSAIKAFESGNYSLFASALLIGAVSVLRGQFADTFPFLKSDIGAAAFTFFVGFVGALGTALLGGSPVNMALVATAFKVTLGAMGGYSAFKKLLVPAVWGGISDTEHKIAVLETELEIAKNPPKGVEGVIGEVEEIS